MSVYQDKERGTWFCSFYYTDWQGVKRKKTKRGFKLKREGQAWERSFLEQEQGAPNMTFASLVDLYLADMKSRFREYTFIKRSQLIRIRLLPSFKNLAINEIKPTTIRHWQNDLIAEGLSDSYLRSLHGQLSTIFNYAVKYYGLSENPCRKAGTIGKQNGHEMKFWTKEEYLRFIKGLEDKPQTHSAFQLLYWCGLRLGELLALNIGDIDFERRTLNINKSYQRINQKDIITEPKTYKSIRVVTIPEFLCVELKALLEHIYDPKPDKRLFPYQRSFIDSGMTRACKKTGVKRIRVHDIRHSHASLLVDMGLSPLLIADRLGHEKIDVTLNTYSHLYPNKQEELAQNLDKMGSTASNQYQEENRKL